MRATGSARIRNLKERDIETKPPPNELENTRVQKVAAKNEVCVPPNSWDVGPGQCSDHFRHGESMYFWIISQHWRQAQPVVVIRDEHNVGGWGTVSNGGNKKFETPSGRARWRFSVGGPR